MTLQHVSGILTNQCPKPVGLTIKERRFVDVFGHYIHFLLQKAAAFVCVRAALEGKHVCHAHPCMV